MADHTECMCILKLNPPNIFSISAIRISGRIENIGNSKIRPFRHHAEPSRESKIEVCFIIRFRATS